MILASCKIEMKEYQDPKLARKNNIITTLSDKIILQGVVEGVTESSITKAIKDKNSLVHIDNIILKRCHKNGALTGQVKLVLKGKQDIYMIRKMLPLSLGNIGQFRNVELDEQQAELGKRKMIEIQKLVKRGEIELENSEIERFLPIVQKPTHIFVSKSNMNLNQGSALSGKEVKEERESFKSLM